MSISAEVIRNSAGLQAVMAAMAELKKREVCIGIPEDTAGRKDTKDTPVNNAELLFIHTNGSPIKNIPPRPVLEPAVKHYKDRVSNNLKAVVEAALDGNTAGVLSALEMAGLDGQNIARKWFTDSVNGWPPNAPITIHGGWMRDRSSGKMIKVKGKGSERPLVDTDEMRKSITFVVREV